MTAVEQADEQDIISQYLADKRTVQKHFDELMKKNDSLEVRDFLGKARVCMLARIDDKWADYLSDIIGNTLQEY